MTESLDNTKFQNQPNFKIRLIEIKTFIHATESLEKIMSIFQDNFENKDIQANIEIDHCQGTHGQKIFPLVIQFSTQKLIKQFLSFLKEKMTDQSKHQLNYELDRRLDPKFKLFLRFDKQQAIIGQFSLVNHSDVFQIIIYFYNKNPKVPINSQYIKKYLRENELILDN
ncbi:RNA-binding domain-containing protein [Candidatus Harpocratesius sp.]